MIFIRQHRLFRQLLFSNTLSTLGKTLFDLVFVLYAATFPNPELAVSIVVAVTSLPYFFSFVFGYLSDKVKRPYHFLLKTKVLQALMYLLFAILALFPHQWWLFFCVVVINVVSDGLADFNGYLTLTLNQQVVEEAELAQALGLQNGFYQIVNLIGKTLGATLIVILQDNYAVFGVINASVFFLSFCFLLRIKTAFPEEQASKPTARIHLGREIKRFGRETWRNLKLLVKLKELSNYVFLFLLMNFISSSVFSLILILLVKNHSLWFGNLAFTISSVELAEVLAMILGSIAPLAVVKKCSLTTNTMMEIVATIFFVYNLFWLQNKWLLLVLAAVIGYLSSVSNPKITSLILRVTPKGNQNAMFSIYSTLITLTIPFASFIVMGVNTSISDAVVGSVLLVLLLLSLILSIRLYMAPIK
ncbi:MFS transporter [Streptococcus sp. zg-JUN1979]|uniref:MFS transporter n=1 Tax=Streptococcus sp. zg-JUN1979 TaxID=3391450 RepID=UPI0039B10C5B